MPSSTTKAKREVAAATAASSGFAAALARRPPTPRKKATTPPQRRGTPSKRQAAALAEQPETTTTADAPASPPSSPFVSPSKRSRTPTSNRYHRPEDEGSNGGSDDVDLGQARCLFENGSARDDKAQQEEPAIYKTPQKPKKEGKTGFGTPSSIQCSPSVKAAYSIVRRCTGSLGGNGAGGAIYGELTTGSMQKVVDVMIEHCSLGKDSIFIDVGAGLGKPNIHVAQYPGVAASYGIEHEQVRWQLSLHNLKHLLQAAEAEDDDSAPGSVSRSSSLASRGSEGSDAASSLSSSSSSSSEDRKINHKIFFHYGDVTEARTLDPFTHVYMFDIGFPPTLFYDIADRFNASRSPYLICYHGPKLIAERYGFDVELITQIPTSMHGSSEGHTAYFYRRGARTAKAAKAKSGKQQQQAAVCDPLFKEGLDLLKGPRDGLHAWVKGQMDTHFTSPRPVRNRRSTKLFATEA